MGILHCIFSKASISSKIFVASAVVVMVQSNCIKNSTEAMHFSANTDKIMKEQLVSPINMLTTIFERMSHRTVICKFAYLNTKSRCLLAVIIAIISTK